MKLTTLESMLAGAIAGSATVLITNPIWVVNTHDSARLGVLFLAFKLDEQSARPGPQPYSPPKKPLTISIVVALWNNEGPFAFFAGVLPALVLVINPILQYTIFEQLRNVLEKRRRVTPRDVFVLEALGKLLATSITYPYITVKSRMHVANRSSDGKEEGIGAALTRIVREEGWGGLYKGNVSPFGFTA